MNREDLILIERINRIEYKVTYLLTSIEATYRINDPRRDSNTSDRMNESDIMDMIGVGYDCLYHKTTDKVCIYPYRDKNVLLGTKGVIAELKLFEPINSDNIKLTAYKFRDAQMMHELLHGYRELINKIQFKENPDSKEVITFSNGLPSLVDEEIIEKMNIDELKYLSIQILRNISELYRDKPGMYLMMSLGIKCESYNTTANGTVESWSGECEVQMADGQKWLCTTTRASGDAWFAMDGGIHIKKID